MRLKKERWQRRGRSSQLNRDQRQQRSAPPLRVLPGISENATALESLLPGVDTYDEKCYHEAMKHNIELEQFWNDYVRSQPSLQGQRYYEAFSFGNSERMANELATLVVNGVKTATSASLWSLEQEQQSVVQVGDYSIVTDWEHRPVCIIQTTEVRIIPFKDVDAQFAYDYGEGERTLAWWKQNLWDYYVQECAAIGRQATQEMPLVCERFQKV